MKTSLTKLETEGFVTVPYPLAVRKSVLRLVTLWKNFCELPSGSKRRFKYRGASTGIGYELKRGLGNKADHKENFDITTEGLSWLKAKAKSIDDPTASDFVQGAVNLVGEIKPMIIRFARMAQTQFDLTGFAEEVEDSEDRFFIRFIHYPAGQKPGTEIATAHTDQSGFTLHLFESDAGLQCLTYNSGKWIDMPVSLLGTVIIPAMQIQLRSRGKLRALCHRVTATSKTAKVGRYSAVCFVQLKDTPKYNKKLSGRLQEKVPGFNYQMSHEEFSMMFK